MVDHTNIYSLSGKRIWVAGHRGMLGSALLRDLEDYDCEVLTVPRKNVDLLSQDAVFQWVKVNKPHAVIVAAAKVGGIHANNEYPAEFLYQNMMIASNIIHASYQAKVSKLLYLGSSCIYPKFAEQPISEYSLLTGALEPTNECYAIAKIAGIKLCQSYRRQYGCDFISAMPTNLYGPGDNYHPKNSHVIPALIRKIHEAKTSNLSSVEIWGTGQVRREFMHTDDCANALIHVLQNYSEDEHINIGVGQDVTIQEVALSLAKIADYRGDLVNNLSMPDGTPRKLLSNQKLEDMGWKASISLKSGLEQAYDWYIQNLGNVRRR